MSLVQAGSGFSPQDDTSEWLVSNVSLPLETALVSEGEPLRFAAATKLRIPVSQVVSAVLYRRSVDARHKEDIHFVATLAVRLVPAAAAMLSLPDVTPFPEQADLRTLAFSGHAVVPEVPPVVCGAGPAGLFAALTLAQAGWHPLVVERGADVGRRRAAVDAFITGGPLDTATNIQFGEGGAGTFSDGKLSTGTHDPRGRQVLQAFVDAGAPAEILWQAKPHIGTDLLAGIVQQLRERIIALGGTVLFDTQLVGLSVSGGRLEGVQLRDAHGERSVPCKNLLLACGHSARDTFRMLEGHDVPMERKPFSMGVRIEHLQEDIDRVQYGRAAGHPALGAADYRLSCHLSDRRGVYTFCMCPGGVVVPAASEEGGVVTNGMSSFARDGRNADAGFLADVRPDDLPGDGVLAGMEFQRYWERKAFEAGGGTYAAPVQLMGDFLDGRATSAQAGQSNPVQPSYGRGVRWGSVCESLPPFIVDALREAAPLFDRRLHGFARSTAVLTGIESRSSSPVRIVRETGSYESTGIAGLYPCGEGAGYAGGIMSAAVDGIRVAQAVVS